MHRVRGKRESSNVLPRAKFRGAQGWPLSNATPWSRAHLLDRSRNPLGYSDGTVGRQRTLGTKESDRRLRSFVPLSIFLLYFLAGACALCYVVKGSASLGGACGEVLRHQTQAKVRNYFSTLGGHNGVCVVSPLLARAPPFTKPFILYACCHHVM